MMMMMILTSELLYHEFLTEVCTGNGNFRFPFFVWESHGDGNGRASMTTPLLLPVENGECVDAFRDVEQRSKHGEDAQCRPLILHGSADHQSVVQLVRGQLDEVDKVQNDVEGSQDEHGRHPGAPVLQLGEQLVGEDTPAGRRRRRRLATSADGGAWSRHRRRRRRIHRRFHQLFDG